MNLLLIILLCYLILITKLYFITLNIVIQLNLIFMNQKILIIHNNIIFLPIHLNYQTNS